MQAREAAVSDATEKAPATPPGDSREAMRSLVDKPYLDTSRYEGQQWRANRKGAHLLIVEFEKAFIKRCAEIGIPMFCHCMVRTPDEQRQLFKDGYSNDSPDDGMYPHKACAVDIVHSKYGWNLTVDQWAVIGHIGKEVAQLRGIKITWGGDWKTKRFPNGDPAHWELTEWEERQKEVLQ
jgi:hypothetical protein